MIMNEIVERYMYKRKITKLVKVKESKNPDGLRGDIPMPIAAGLPRSKVDLPLGFIRRSATY